MQLSVSIVTLLPSIMKNCVLLSSLHDCYSSGGYFNAAQIERCHISLGALEALDCES